MASKCFYREKNSCTQLKSHVRHDNIQVQSSEGKALTSIVANYEIHIWAKLERTKRMMAHEILQTDAFNESNVALRTQAGNNI